MSFRSALSVLVLAISSAASVGCAAEAAGDPSASSADQLVLEGNVGASAATTTKSFGAISTAKGQLHVTAREVHVRGTNGRSVDVDVAPDGSFRVDIARGSRWVVTVDDADGNSAMVTFGNGNNVLRVRADGSASRVNIGALELVGGQARSSIALDAALGIEATLAGIDDVFEAANGTVIAAREAAEQAREAAEQARQAAEAARDSAEAARQAAEEARRNAGL